MNEGAGPASGPGSDAEGPRGWDRATLVAAAAVLLVQVGLMLGAFMPSPHTGGDNAGYLGLAYSLLERGAYLDLYLPGEPLHTKYPPGFPLLLAGARILGAESWVAFKAVVAGTASLAVLFTFFWARERKGAVFAALIAGLLAASSALVDYSHWILSDVPFLALTFLALWGLERADRSWRAAAPADGAGPGGPAGRGWLVLGCAAAIAAVATRSAGLPLILAVAGWLGLRRRWKGLVAFGAAFGVPAAAWWIRSLARTDAYLSEFWLVNPYRPELGRAGPMDMVSRLGTNLWGYTAQHIPSGIVGFGGGPGTVAGVILVALALWGWGARVRQGRTGLGVPELFVPLYAGLILVWPEVWSGDRFALPLIPLLLYYSGSATLDLAGRLHRRGPVVAGAVGLVLLGGPALVSWSQSAGRASDCMGITRTRGAWACAGSAMTEFVTAAGWSGAHLPEDAVVISRKPRFFFLMSRLKSEMFPLSREPGRLFSEAERLGARYLVLDRLDGLAGYYVAPVVRSRPQAFCALSGVGGQGQGSPVLGVLSPSAEEEEDGSGQGERIRLAGCPDRMLRDSPRPVPDYSSSSIPLFSWARS